MAILEPKGNGSETALSKMLGVKDGKEKMLDFGALSDNYDTGSVGSNGTSSEAMEEILQRKYKDKMEQDVGVFLAFAEQMSLQSLLFILQGHAREQMGNIRPDSAYAEALNVVEKQKTSMKTKKKIRKRVAIKTVQKGKQFRFAEVMGHEVRCVTYEIESWKDHDLWWSDEEMVEIRSKVVKTVKFFRKNRPEYQKAVEIVASLSDEDDADARKVERMMKQLIKDGYARGMEAHITSFLTRLRRDSVLAVLEEQEDCLSHGDSYEVACEYLREQSLAYSEQSMLFASRIAECDHVEAMKAQLSKWEPDL